MDKQFIRESKNMLKLYSVQENQPVLPSPAIKGKPEGEQKK